MLSSATQRAHDRETGRFDAEEVARLYELRLAQLSGAIGQRNETLRKNPCREGAQDALSRLVHAWDQLETIFSSRQQIKAWLHHPMPEDGRRPLDVLMSDDGLNRFTRLVGRIATSTYR